MWSLLQTPTTAPARGVTRLPSEWRVTRADAWLRWLHLRAERLWVVLQLWAVLSVLDVFWLASSMDLISFDGVIDDSCGGFVLILEFLNLIGG